MIDKIIRFIYYSLFLVTPLLMFPQTSELFEFNKMIFIYLIAVLVFFFWSLKCFYEKKITLKRTPLDIPILIFFGSQILSTIFSIDRHTSIFGYYGRFNGGLAATLAYLILFYGFVLFFDKSLKEKFLKISLLSSLIVVLWGLPAKFGYDLSCFLFVGQFNNSCWTDQFRPGERMFSTLGQPNWLGAYLAINFFVGLYFLIRQPKTHPEGVRSFILYVFYLVLNFSAILFTRSRSALLAVFVGLIAFGILLLLRFIKEGDLIKDAAKKLVPLGIGMIVAILLFKTGITKIDRYIDLSSKLNPSTSSGLMVSEVETIKVQSSKVEQISKPKAQLSSEITESLDIRKIVWKGAIDLGLRYPFFGSGVETFAYSYYFVRPREHNLTSEWDYLYNKAHNEYLNYLATTGFIGFGAYLVVIGSVLLLFYSLKIETWELKILNLALFSAYLTILITNFFGFSTTAINIFFYLIPGFLILDLKDQRISESRMGKIPADFFLITNFVIMLYLIIALIRYFIADISYAQANGYMRVNDYQQASGLLNRAYRIRKEHVYADKLSFALANLAFVAAYDKQTDLTKSLVDLSKKYNDQSLKESPQNVLYWKTKGKNEYLFYEIDLDRSHLESGIFALQEAGRLSPTDPKIPYSKAIFYSILEDEEIDKDKKNELMRRSLAEIDKSVTLKQDYRDGFILKAQLLKKYNEKESAKKTLEFILKKISPEDQEVKEELKKL